MLGRPTGRELFGTAPTAQPIGITMKLGVHVSVDLTKVFFSSLGTVSPLKPAQLAALMPRSSAVETELIARQDQARRKRKEAKQMSLEANGELGPIERKPVATPACAGCELPC